MIRKEFNIKNKSGLHARPAAELKKTAASFKSNILIEYKDAQVNAKSLVKILSLGVNSGSKVIISAQGEDEKAAMDSIEELIAADFNE